MKWRKETRWSKLPKGDEKLKLTSFAFKKTTSFITRYASRPKPYNLKQFWGSSIQQGMYSSMPKYVHRYVLASLGTFLGGKKPQCFLFDWMNSNANIKFGTPKTDHSWFKLDRCALYLLTDKAFFVFLCSMIYCLNILSHNEITLNTFISE